MQKLSQSIALIYCSDNQEVAQNIEIDLQSVVNFEHFICGKNEQGSISEMLDGFDGPIVLLISDNFLRTVQCMKHGLNMLNNYQDQILPVVVEGFRIDQDGEKEVVFSDFSRFKQIVQYINFWQDRYLELRQKKRTDPDLHDEGFANYINVIRDIAGEAGQYLRTLQTLDLVNHNTFTEDSYAVLFEFLEEEELWESFKGKLPSIEEEEEEEEMNIENIPGMDLLAIASETKKHEPELGHAVEEVEVSQDETHRAEITKIINQSWDLSKSNQRSTAIDLMGAAIKKHPSSIALYYNLVLFNIEEKNFIAAEQALTELFELSQSAEVYFLAGELADSQGKTKEAIQHFKKVIEINDDYPDVYFVLALLTQIDTPEDKDQIEIYYNTALAKNKKNSLASYELALLYQRQNQAKLAVKFFKKTLKIDPNHLFANYDLALIHHAENAFEKANKRYQKAIQINPELQTEDNDTAFDLTDKIDDKDETIKALNDKIKALEALLAEK